MRDVHSQEMLAVKLIPRPIPKAIVPEHVFREIKACSFSKRSLKGTALCVHCLFAAYCSAYI